LPSHRVQTEELSLVIGDNAADGDHQAGYNGIWDLRSVHDEAPFFVPPYCGMNFEFIAPKAREDPTEPKDHPTQLSIEGDEVVLHQGSTPTHAVESWMRYRPSGPAHIDWTFRYKLHDPGAFSTGIAGFFFASYIDRPENKAIYVLSRDVYDAMMWVQYCTTFQGVESAIVWEGDDYDLTFGDCEHGLYTSRAPIRYAVPLMLGRRGAMAFCLMFADPAGVVISHGMGGGGFVPDESDRNPAWDFFLYARDPQVYAEGEWRGRLVYKKFAGRADILREYQAYQRALGRDWAMPAYGPVQA